MKNKIISLGLVTAIIAFASISKCKAQAPKQESKAPEIKFDAYGKFAQAQHEALKVEIDNNIRSLQRQWQKIDSVYWNGFVAGQLIANNVTLDRISQNGDSLKITADGIFYKLKPKKK